MHKWFVALGALLVAPEALADGAWSISQGVAAVPTGDDTFAPEPVMTMRMVAIFDDSPFGMGTSLRAHGGPQGVDIGLSQDLCVGSHGEVAASLCAGLTLYNSGYREGSLTHGLLSPVVEPSFRFPVGDHQVFLSAPMGYDFRYGQEGNYWAGITVGLGGHSD